MDNWKDTLITIGLTIIGTLLFSTCFLLEIIFGQESAKMESLMTIRQKQNIGDYCRKFRKDKMGLTIEDVSHETDINPKTLLSFERGQSTNMLILINAYWRLSPFKTIQTSFINGLWEVL